MTQAIANVQQISHLPAVVHVNGKTATDRRLNVIAAACGVTRMALAGEKGKVGTAARSGLAQAGFSAILRAVTEDKNYRPLAEYIAAITGQSISIPNRAAFESLPFRFEDFIANERAKKAGGLTKNGDDSATVKMWQRLASDCAGLIEAVEAYHAARLAKKSEATSEAPVEATSEATAS